MTLSRIKEVYYKIDIKIKQKSESYNSPVASLSPTDELQVQQRNVISQIKSKGLQEYISH